MMEQVQNKLSIIYDLGNEREIVSASFDINNRKLNIECTCCRKYFCHHTDFLVDYIYNSYFHNNEIDNDLILLWASDNKLWLPVQETDDNDIVTFINIELVYSCNKFNYYCSYCNPGIHKVENCRHLDYIIKKFTEHYYELKEQNDEINNINFDSINFNQNNSSMEIDN